MDQLATPRTVVLGSLAFWVFWVTATFPKFHGLPVGRTAGAIVGATLMIVFQVDSPDQAYASVNLPILGLLFGTMVVSIYLQRADMFKYLASALSYRCRGGKDLLCRLSFLIAITSALFTNDTCCVLFTEFILIYCKDKGYPPEPFLLALATSANIGSAATPIGNPQNLVIAIASKISFGKFLIGILPAMLVGVTANLGLLLAMYWKQLSKGSMPMCELKAIKVQKADMEKQPHDTNVEEGKNEKVMNSDADAEDRCQSSPDDKNPTLGIYPPLENLDIEDINGNMSLGDLTQMTHQCSAHRKDRTFSEECTVSSIVEAVHLSSELKPEKGPQNTGSPKPSAPQLCEASSDLPESQSPTFFKKWRRYFWKPSVYLVTLGMLGALLAGLDLSWCTITAAIVLVVIDFRDAGPSLNKVSYSLLVFFSGMFITVDGFNRTGIPATFWNVVEPHARINHLSGTAVLSTVIILLSNVASNVPTVLLLGPKIAASTSALPGASVNQAWLILAWASTVAGNLTLVGSAANLIVCEQARMAPKVPFHLSFWRHLKFGFPSTLVIVAVGLPLIRA
eukprot:c18807_g1_i3 orf=184-1881(+)